MDTKKVIDNKVYELYHIKTFRQTFWHSSKYQHENIKELVDDWITGSTQGKWFFKKPLTSVGTNT